MDELNYNFSIEDVSISENYEDLRKQLTKINAEISLPENVYDPHQSALTKQKKIFEQKQVEDLGNEKIYYGVVLDFARSAKLPELVEVYIDVPGINQKNISHPDVFVEPGINLEFYEDMIFYHIDVNASRENVPILGGIALVKLSKLYPNHREIDKMSNRYLKMFSDVPFITVSKENRRLVFTPAQSVYRPTDGFTGGYSSPDASAPPPPTSGQPIPIPVGETSDIAKQEKISDKIIKTTPVKPNNLSVLLMGDSHTVGSFGVGIMTKMTKLGYTVTKLSQGGVTAYQYVNKINYKDPTKGVARDMVQAYNDYQNIARKQAFDICIIALGTNDIANYIIPTFNSKGLTEKNGELRGAEFIYNKILEIKNGTNCKNYWWILPPLFSKGGAKSYAGLVYEKNGQKDLNARTEILYNYIIKRDLQGIKIIKLSDLMIRYQSELSDREIHFFPIGKKVGNLVSLYVANNTEVRSPSDINPLLYQEAEKK